MGKDKHGYLRAVDPTPIAVAERTLPPPPAGQDRLSDERIERIISAILMCRRIEHDHDLVFHLKLVVLGADAFGEPLDPSRILRTIDRFGRGDLEFTNKLAAVNALAMAFGRDDL